MATLIHLNGPPGVGKSTLAQRYVDEHHGVLDLDIDRVVTMLGRWKDDFGAAVGPARAIAIAMAETHLRSGFDVVMPQLVTSHDEVARFEAAVDGAGASYVEVGLDLGSVELISRYHRRTSRGPVEDEVARFVDAQGGDAFLESTRRRFVDYLEHRPLAYRIQTRDHSVEATYAAVLSILDRAPASGAPGHGRPES